MKRAKALSDMHVFLANMRPGVIHPVLAAFFSSLFFIGAMLFMVLYLVIVLVVVVLVLPIKLLVGLFQGVGYIIDGIYILAWFCAKVGKRMSEGRK